MNDYPSTQEDNDENYFNSGSFRQDLTDSRSSHADALHADALGRDITPRDTARSDYLGAEPQETAASQLGSSSAAYQAESYGQDELDKQSVSDGVGYGGSENRSAPSDQLYGSHRSIDSTYFNITSANDGPVAGLNVLMDTGGQAIRAELYLYEESNEADKQEAIRQANQILKRQFSSGTGQYDNQMLELRIFETQQKYATVYVDLPERDETAVSGGVRQSASYGKGASGSVSPNRSSLGGASFFDRFFDGGLSRLWPLALAALALLFGLGILWWILSSFLGGGGFGLADGTSTQGEVAIESAADGSQLSTEFDPNKPILNLGGNQGETVQAEVVQGEVVQGVAVQDTTTTDQGEVVQGQPSGDTQAVVQPAALEWVNPSEENRNGLPESIRADSTIRGSSRVRVMQGIQIMLRSYPGPAAGTELGVMQDGDEGIVVGGPYYTEGERDTIVWWYVRLDSGSEAWVAANTSDLTLLEAVQ